MMPSWWEAGHRHLATADPVLAALMAQHPTGMLRSRGQALECLLRAIVGQQISVLAADAVWRKFIAAVGEMTPQRVLSLTPDQLRACGLSGQKARYISGIAQGFADGTVHPGLWNKMDDEAIVAELTRLPGIGRWTAEMFLMFHLLKPNVLPLGDLGLLKGYVHVYGDVEEMPGSLTPQHVKLANQPPAAWRPLAADVLKRSRLWQPYCSLATWYLWRALDPVEVGY